MSARCARLLSATIAVAAVVLLAAAPNAVAVGQVLYRPWSPPVGYLANPGNNAGGKLEHMLDGTKGGVSVDILQTTPGEYCTYAIANTALVHQNSLDQSGVTGFSPPRPFEDWQEGDTAGPSNVCQAAGGTWGFKLSGATNANCTQSAPCNMHHFVRLGGDVRPWQSAWAAPTFSVDVKPRTVSGGNAVGFFCALLRDVTTPNLIEYCVMEWKVGQGYPQNELPRVTCADTQPPGSGYHVDTVWTRLDASHPEWVLQRPGSSNTLGSVPGSAHQSFSISAQNLRNVIELINGPQPQPIGCKERGDSTNVADYRLIGFEDGVEGGGSSLIGASVSGEYVTSTFDTLYPDRSNVSNRLPSNSTISSASGNYRLQMRSDGNLVLYGPGPSSTAVVWASGTSTPGAYLDIQADGNLVIYGPQGPALWSSNTFTTPNCYCAYPVVQDDGRLVLYRGAQAMWARP